MKPDIPINVEVGAMQMGDEPVHSELKGYQIKSKTFIEGIQSMF